MASGEVCTSDAGAASNPLVALVFQYFDAWDRASVLGPDARQLSTRFFADMSRAMDTYMRSPVFLELMRRTLQTMTDRPR